MDIPFKLLNKNDFPYLDDDYVGKPYGILYGPVSAIKLICVNTNENSNNQNVTAIYKLPELITNIGDAYVEVDDVFKSAIISKTDYEKGLLYISNGRSSSGSSYEVKLVNCVGYLDYWDTLKSYPKQVLEHFFSYCAGIEYTDSNFDKAQWESELGHESVQAEIGFYLNDTSVDFWTQVYNISRMSKTLFRVDYTRDGKIYAKRIDLNRTSRYVIPSCEIKNANSLELKPSREGVHSSILTKYGQNYYSESWLSVKNNTYEKDVKRNYKKSEEYKDETYLQSLADAQERAYNLANIHSEKETTVELEIFKHYDIDLYDVITVSLMPDNLSASSRIFAGNRDCLVLSVNPKESELINYVNVQIIPDRVPLESQSAVLSDEFTTIEKEKSSSDIIYDTISDSVNTVAYSTRPLITLYTDVQGNVNSYDDAVGNIKTFSGETDVTGSAVYGIDFQDEGVTVDIQTGGEFSITEVTNDISIVVFSSTYNGVKNKVNVTINKIIQGAVVIPNELFPDEVPELSAAAYQEYIEINWSWSKTELRNTLGNFLLEISKNSGTDWEPVTTTATRFIYYFDRFIDKYPDKTETTSNSPYPLSNWRFRIKAKNIYGNYSDAYYPSSLGTTLNIDNYKKWTPTKPVVTVVADETGLDVEYSCDESTFFGIATYSLYVKGALKLSGIVGKKTRYTFDRVTDGYPEKVSNGGDLDTWGIVVRVSTEGGSTNSDAAHPDVLNYLTWVTPKPTVTAIAGELGISYSYDLDESSYYGTSKTRKLVINSIVKKTGISMFDGQYKFDRDTDGYPEKSSERIAHGITGGIALDEWAIQVVAVSAEFTTGTISDVVYPDVTNYLTYIPHAPTVSGSCGNRDASIIPIVGNQTYNHAGFRTQITRKGNAGVTDDAGFYALGNSENARIDETSYRSGSIGGYTFEAIASTDTIDQVLPLINQSAKLPVDTKYYYRIYTIVSVPTTASPAAVNVSLVSSEKLIIAKGTGNYDIVSKAVEEAHLGDQAVTNRVLGLLAVLNANIGNETIEMAKFAAGIRPPRVVSALPANPYTGYAKDDTVILTTDNKLYTLINVSLPGTTGWTRKIDGLDLIADTVTAGAVAAGAIGTRELAVGDGLNIMAYDLCSFENFADGYIPTWTHSNSTISISNENYLDGLRSLKIITGSSFSGYDCYVFLGYAPIYSHNVESGKKYIFSGYFYSSVTATIALALRTNDGGYHISSVAIVPAGLWTRLAYSYVIPIGINSLVPFFYILTQSVTIYADAFQLEECESTASEPSGYRSSGLTTIDGQLIKTRTINAQTAIIEGSITANEVATNGLSATNLNVNARNILNSFIYSSDGTTGWAFGSGASFETVDGYRTLRLTAPGTTGVFFLSDEFIVNPTDIIKFSFGLSCPNYTSESGLFIGLTVTQTFKRYIYNFTTKKWIYSSTGTNSYFLSNYIATSRKNFGTYILGADVDIFGVPAPDYTDTTYSIYCLQLSSGDSVARIRSGYNPVTAGTYWRLFLPRAILTDSSKIVAEKIVVEKLSSITTNPGTLQGDDAANYKLVMSPSASETDPEGTLLLGAIADASYFRRYKSGGVWVLDIKTSTFKVDSISSTVLGNFAVQTTGGVDRFLVNPDSYIGVYGIPFLVYAGAGGNYNDGVRIANSSVGRASIEFGSSWGISGWQTSQCRIVKLIDGTMNIVLPNIDNNGTVNALNFVKGGAATFVSHVYVGGTLTVTSNITMNSSGGILTGPYGEMIRSTDEWLRLNAGEQHTSGIYCGSSLLRTDGEFQIGNAGAFAKITAAGAMTLNSTLTIGGVAYLGSGLLTHGKTSYTDGISGEILGGDGRVEIFGATPFIDFHFANSTADYTTRIIEDVSGVLNLIGTLRPSYLGRKTHSSGCLVGGYNNIGASETKVSPIYTIGSSYMPNDTSVESLRGIFFSHSNFWGTNGINARTGWGLGLASGGGILGLLTENGLWTDGDVYAAGNIYGIKITTTGGALGANCSGTDIGVQGNGLTGVYGVGGTSGNGVYGLCASGNGVRGVSTSGTGVRGTSESESGVYGSSSTGNGVSGVGSVYGVYGSGGTGVYGTGGAGKGVWGDSTSGVGVWGDSASGTAVYGNSTSGTGVIGVGGYIGVGGIGATWDFYASGAGGNYGPFTGSHEILIKGVLPEIGMIMTLTGRVIKRNNNISATIPECTISTKENDSSVFGVFTTLFELPEDHWCEDKAKKFGICNALGDGQVLVTNINGEINCGDYITTSEIAGYGEKQNDKILHSYTLGKCTESINWDKIQANSDGIKRALIACVYVSA